MHYIACIRSVCRLFLFSVHSCNLILDVTVYGLFSLPIVVTIHVCFICFV